jgi:Tol biopolymer transport system component
MAAGGAPREFQFPGPARYGIYLADLETGRIRYIGGLGDWSLSPDGKWVAGTYGVLREHCYDLYLFNLTTGNKTFLHRYVPPVDDLIILEFAWSADSRWLRLTSQWDRDGLPRSDLFAVPPGAPRVAAAAFRLAGYEVLEAVYSPGRRAGRRVQPHL